MEGKVKSRTWLGLGLASPSPYVALTARWVWTPDIIPYWDCLHVFCTVPWHWVRWWGYRALSTTLL